MGKRIESPIKRFAGAVELKDPLPYYLVTKYEAAGQISRAWRAAHPDFDPEKTTLGDIAALYEPYIPVVIEAVEKWDIVGLPEKPTAETWPGTPRKAAISLLAWLIGQVTELYAGNGDDDPNG